MNRFLLALLLSTLLVACVAPATPTPDLPTATPLPPTATPRPTATPEPTSAPTMDLPLDLAPLATPRPVAPVGLAGELPPGSEGLPWWNDAVFYEVFVRSFYDSDGDGVGDLQGLIQQLDYLNDGDPNTTDDLGVTGIWLMPIHQSPSYHGYDVTDYYQVDDEYGTNADFLQLMEAAHARGIYVIIDLVLNHTSAQHPWFQASRDPNSDFRDWYLWSDQAGRGWHRDGSAYYFGIFWDQMPDLNYENPAVTTEMHEVIRFWLEEMQVDGFRLDAIKHLIEEGVELENTPGTLAWFEDFYSYYKSLNPAALTVGEVWSPTEEIVWYVGDKVDIAFEFQLAEAIVSSAFSGRRSGLAFTQEAVIRTYPAGQFATFLANHDQTRIRSRLMNDGQAKVAASLQLTFPGVPFIYYGEEIGMLGAKPDENIRRPLQWTPEGGFTTGTPWRGYYEDVAERNIAVQSADPDSLLNHYRALIHLRNRHAALRGGDWLPVASDHRAIHSYLRVTAEEIILVVINLGGSPVSDYTLELASGPFAAEMPAAWLMGAGDLYAPPVNTAGGFGPYRPTVEIPTYGTQIVQFSLP